METLESSRVCRLCGKQSGISINIFDRNENHVKKINAVLPIMVHEMDLLPKHMCHRCSYKLEEFHKFYIDCLKTDTDLKSQLSWMRTEAPRERVGIPMVHIENVKIKIEPLDYDAYDMNPMDDNVNYINSMSSVTFQPNDIPYATYARCRCCCDKMDQSNRTVSANYETTISSRCNRLDSVQANGSGHADELQAVKKNVIANKMRQKRPYVTTQDKRYNKEPRNSRSASSNFDHVNEARAMSDANKGASGSTVVRNLRPRTGFVDYVGSKKKTPSNSPLKCEKPEILTQQSIYDTTWIKTEKFDDYEGRTLRPRKRMINYCGAKRKYTKSDKKQRPQDKENRTSEHKVRNIASKLKLPLEKNRKLPENKIKFAIKQEQASDLEDTVFDELFMAKPKNHAASSFRDRANKIDALPRDFLNVRNDRVNYNMLNCTQQDTKFSVANDPRSLKSVSKDKLKSRKVDSNRIASISNLPKHPRNRDGELRSGKIRKLDAANASDKKLQRTLRNITDRGKSTNKGLMKTITDIVSKQKISALKFNDSNIKHYCEDCNMRFLNKELLKLHACYR